MPQNELLDRIMDCFKEYNYWPLKALNDRLNQPEAYLKQTLEMVADLVRQGPFAMNWQLKPESRMSNNQSMSFEAARDETAPDTGGMEEATDLADGSASDEDDEDDDNVEMEDVAL
jgi:transcription initiation factor TFIIF subunit beta